MRSFVRGGIQGGRPSVVVYPRNDAVLSLRDDVCLCAFHSLPEASSRSSRSDLSCPLTAAQVPSSRRGDRPELRQTACARRSIAVPWKRPQNRRDGGSPQMFDMRRREFIHVLRSAAAG